MSDDPLAPAGVPARLAAESRDAAPDPAARAAQTAALVRGLLARRRDFGITRLGAITRLDRVGLPVMQAVRPLALSNAVSQGKGLDPVRAAASALMEALESWASETIAPARLTSRAAAEMNGEVAALYTGSLLNRADPGWHRIALGWIDGWDLFAGRVIPVPAALVDTVYTYPSPHPVAFPRTTTGLAAGVTLHGALIHAGLEVLERAGVAAAARRPHFFDRAQIDAAAVAGPVAASILARIRAAGLAAGIWRVEAAHDLPIYWCHVVERAETPELAPLPGEGFGCDVTHDGALAKALMEACQARATAIAGTREDITRGFYPERHDRPRLEAWRRHILGGAHLADNHLSDNHLAGARPSPPPDAIAPPPGAAAVLDRLLDALRMAGARAAIVVPLLRLDAPEVHVLRLVVPPLRQIAPAGVA